MVLSVPEAIEDLSAMKRLWVHEVMRIYHDKIIDLDDSNWFMKSLTEVTGRYLKENLNELLNHLLLDEESEVCAFNSSIPLILALFKLFFCSKRTRVFVG